MTPWSARIARPLFEALQAHLFQADGGEHGAVIAAGVVRGEKGSRLLLRQVFYAEDGRDYVPGNRGHRMLKAEFVTDCVLRCRDEKVAYLAVHNHGHGNSVGFSSIDLDSHERGYPALLDVIRGQPVGALVFASGAVAGDIWLRAEERVELSQLTVVGAPTVRLAPEPLHASRERSRGFDRQSRLFGDAGQSILAELRVGVIGAGGVGSLLIEYLARLGVGNLVVADPDTVDETNLPRLVAARRSDAFGLGSWADRLFRRRSRGILKVEYACRLVREANPSARFEGLHGYFQEGSVAARFKDCDYLFLAADSMQARFLFNALIHQFLIPGYQVGAKAVVDGPSGRLLDVYSATRPVSPGHGCLWCNGLVTPASLQLESASERERQAQQYVADSEVRTPSVITLNAVAAGHAANDFLFDVVGLQRPNVSLDYLTVRPIGRDIRFEAPRRDDDCSECSVSGRLGRGDSARLPTWE